MKTRDCFQSVDIASLVFFRIAFGGILFYEIVRYLALGRVKEYWVAPSFNFSLDPFGWVQPWPGIGMYIHWCALGVLAALIALGCAYRAAMALFCLGFTYIFLLDEAKYLNHFYFISLVSFLMIFVPANRAFSLDARWRPQIRSDTAPAWALWILAFQMAVVYFFGGIAKLNADWLSGEPMRFWLATRTDYPVVGRWFDQEATVYLFSYGGLALDVFIVPLLLWKRTRVVAFAWAVCFHLLNKWLLGVGIFPWFSIAATLLFFPPDWPRRLGRRIFSSLQLPAPIAHAPGGALGRSQKATLVLLGVYVAVQILAPLRKHLYPGNVNWTEQGHNYAWHMKLRDKSATAVFTVRIPATGESWKIDLDEWLTQRQIDKMSIRPHMILRFSHHVARELERKGLRRPEVRARVMCTLNGRPPQLLIDPGVNLAAVRPSLKAASWLLPLKEPLPPPEFTRRQAAWARGEIERARVSPEQWRLLKRYEGD